MMVLEIVKDIINEVPDSEDFEESLKKSGAEILINLLPVGSDKQLAYTQSAINTGIGFINCIPVFIARDNEWYEKFRAAGVPLIGDDIKSQVGATIVHRVLAQLFSDRGEA